ncbi:NAD(P)-dependent alcohol dehydrogenase [Geitlerinema splendidum]|nr:NAD(P)-dependent alcohol dehydrogenase [Geitlerinema splendidum]
MKNITGQVTHTCTRHLPERFCTMKAVLYERYGDPEVLRAHEVSTPVPADNEVLIRVVSTTVTSGDVRMRRASRASLPLWPLSKLAFGLRAPRRRLLGLEYAGVIEAVGQSVNHFQVGDEVFGTCSSGTYAEYICLPENGVIVRKPASLSFDEAAAIPFGALSALYFLRMAKIQAGQKVLIYGASGSVGTAAVQLAKVLGAEVTAVCSGANFSLVRSLGADHVINYQREDFTSAGERYDVIFETVGKLSVRKCLRALRPGGVLLLAIFDFPQIPALIRSALGLGSKKVLSGTAPEKVEDLSYISTLIEAGLYKAVIDRRFPLDEMAAAHGFVETGRKRGNVVIVVQGVSP